MNAYLVAAAAAALTLVAPRLLSRAKWPYAYPAAGLTAWILLFAATFGAVLAALLSTLVHLPPLQAAVESVTRGHAQWTSALQHPGGRAADVAASVLACAVLALVAVVGVRVTRTAGRQRAAHRLRLRLVGHRAPHCDAVLITDPRPAAFAVPGRGGIVVVTTTARTRLNDDELDAVLAHERSHLRVGHYWLLLASGTLTAAFRWLPAARHGDHAVRLLVEMHADDAAARRASPLAAATALVKLSTGAPSAPGVLAAAGDDVERRIARLLDRRRSGRYAGTLVLTGLAVAAVLPLLLVAEPLAGSLIETATCLHPADAGCRLDA